jgi:hypothetical protein
MPKRKANIDPLSLLTDKPEREPHWSEGTSMPPEPPWALAQKVRGVLIALGFASIAFLLWHRGFFETQHTTLTPEEARQLKKLEMEPDLSESHPFTAADYRDLAKTLRENPNSPDLRPKGWYLIRPPVIELPSPHVVLGAPLSDWVIVNSGKTDEEEQDQFQTYDSASECQKGLVATSAEKSDRPSLGEMMTQGRRREYYRLVREAYRFARQSSKCIAADDPRLGFNNDTLRAGQ